MNDETLPKIAEYISVALNRPLPTEVHLKTKFHLMDTLAAIVTGSELKPGKAAINYILSQGGTPESSVACTSIKTTATNAAMVNAMLAHSNETDDSHAPSLTHPGCAVIPAALAVAEREGLSGEQLLRAIALGYDISSRIGRAMGGINARGMHGHSTHAIGPMFGAAAAASALAGLNERECRHALAYTVQQASGVITWERDPEHIEKAFVFGGVGARNGVTSAMFVQSGMTGEENAFTGDFNFVDTFCSNPNELSTSVETLGSHYEISITNIKKFAVGSPIQAAADAMVHLVNEYKFTPDDVLRIDVLLPPLGAKIVNARTMPDVNLQYALAVIILDEGKLSFEATHSYERLNSPEVVSLIKLVHLAGNPEFEKLEAQRPATVSVKLTNGRTVQKHISAVRGTADNPMTKDEVEIKAHELFSTVLGHNNSSALVRLIWEIETKTTLNSIWKLLSTKPINSN
jgi:2-methylcitrate dehydratase PrpD